MLSASSCSRWVRPRLRKVAGAFMRPRLSSICGVAFAGDSARSRPSPALREEAYRRGRRRSAMVPRTCVCAGRVAEAIATAGVSGDSPAAIAERANAAKRGRAACRRWWSRRDRRSRAQSRSLRQPAVGAVAGDELDPPRLAPLGQRKAQARRRRPARPRCRGRWSPRCRPRGRRRSPRWRGRRPEDRRP